MVILLIFYKQNNLKFQLSYACYDLKFLKKKCGCKKSIKNLIIKIFLGINKTFKIILNLILKNRYLVFFFY